LLLGKFSRTNLADKRKIRVTPRVARAEKTGSDSSKESKKACQLARIILESEKRRENI
jgi:hypothetical protein